MKFFIFLIFFSNSLVFSMTKTEYNKELDSLKKQLKNFSNKEKETYILFHQIINAHFQTFNQKNLYSIHTNKKIFEGILSRLDPNKILFNKLDEEILAKKYSNLVISLRQDYTGKYIIKFLNEMYQLYQKRIVLLDKLSKDVFSLSLKDDVWKQDHFWNYDVHNHERLVFKNYKENIKRYFAFLILENYEIELNETLNEEKFIIKDLKNTFDVTIYSSAKQEAIKSIQEYFKKLKKIKLYTFRDKLLNGLLKSTDPHTKYLPPKEEKEVMNQLSHHAEGIGLELNKNDNGEMEIFDILPGSPVWKSNQIEISDIIESIKENGKEILLKKLSLDDFLEKVRGQRNQKIELKIKRGKRSKWVKLATEELEIDSARVNLSILNNNKEKIAYIPVKNFYKSQNTSLTEDTKKLLIKLNKMKIDNLVIDLRNNSGGFLSEAVSFTGLFIPDGPVVQFKNLNNSREFFLDEDPNIYYKGNLVVLVNGSSASASEIFAAAIQDYNRGLIVGGQQTFGKATVQIIKGLIPIAGNNLGSLKYTVQKYYRVNGESTQNRGVIPDIILPMTSDVFNLYEFSLYNTLVPDKILPLRIKKRKFIKKEELKKTAHGEIYKQKITLDKQKYNEFMMKFTKDKKMSLNYKKFIERFKKIYLFERANELKYENKKLILKDYSINEYQSSQIIKTARYKKYKKKRKNKFYEILKQDYSLNQTLLIFKIWSNI